MKKTLSLLLALVLCLGLLPMAAAASGEPETTKAAETAETAEIEEAGDAPAPAEEGTPAVPSAPIAMGKGAASTSPGGPEDNDQRFAGYAARLFGLEEPWDDLWTDGKAVDYLYPAEREMYEQLKTQILQVAAGQRTSTVFSVFLGEDYTADVIWTAEELDLPYIYREATDDFNSEADDWIGWLISYMFDRVIDALLADLPYELYWYDKTDSTDEEYYVCLYQFEDTLEWAYGLDTDESITFRFPVAAGYGSSYEVRPERVRAAQNAAANARAIVARYAGASDYEKLLGYKNEICALTNYNDEAVMYEDYPYGDPWQMIWVFDNDPSTTVVCEGYAKAFQYLCDLTAFRGPVESRIATGWMLDEEGYGDAHMWNVVTMEDGKNYLVDVTNCDDDSVGAPDYLFLKGYSYMKSYPYIDGDVYMFDCAGDAAGYFYDEETLEVFGTDALALSAVDYGGARPTDPMLYRLGDVNRDGEVDRKDRIYLARYLAGWEGYALRDGAMLAADVNLDGTADRKDRIYLARYLAGWEGYSLGVG